MKQRVLIGITFLVLMTMTSYYMLVYRPSVSLRATPTPTPDLAAILAAQQVVVEARVVPRASVELKFDSIGTVGEVFVNEGDSIKQGTVLARLNTRELKLAVERAEVNVQQVQAAYDKLVAGATSEEIAQAKAEVDRARGQLIQTQGTVTDKDITAAQAHLNTARAALVDLENGPDKADVRAAKANLESARTNLREITAGPDTSDVNAAKARLEQARTHLREVENGPETPDVTAAEAQLDQAREALRKAESGPNEADVAAAQAQLDQAKAFVDGNNAELSAAKTRAESQINQAGDDVRLAQAAYSKAYWDYDTAKHGVDPATGKDFDDIGIEDSAGERTYAEALNQAELMLSQAEENLEQARLAYEQAQQAEIAGNAANAASLQEAEAHLQQVLTSIDAEAVAGARAQVAVAESHLADVTRIDPDQLSTARAGVASAEADLAALQRIEPERVAFARAQAESAQAELDRLLRVDPDQLAAARANVVTAQTELDHLQGTEREGVMAAAAAAVDNAEAVVAQLEADPTQPDLAARLAEVNAAKIALKEAQLAVDLATLTSPIAGTIAQVNVKTGEVPDQNRAAIVVADFREWQIETTDLSELDVAQVHEGSMATMSFDALPGVELKGTVRRIKPIGENKQGDITYTAVIVPNRQDTRLRWNMTAAVVIKITAAGR